MTGSSGGKRAGTPKKTPPKTVRVTVSLADVLLNSPRKNLMLDSKTKKGSIRRVKAEHVKTVTTTPTLSKSTTTQDTSNASNTPNVLNVSLSNDAAASSQTNWYVALFDFSGDAAYHMMSGLSAGDVIRIVRRNESGWWWAHHMQRERDGDVKIREGYVPAEFLKPVQMEKPQLIEPHENFVEPQSTPSYSVEASTRERGGGGEGGGNRRGGEEGGGIADKNKNKNKNKNNKRFNGGGQGRLDTKRGVVETASATTAATETFTTHTKLATAAAVAKVVPSSQQHRKKKTGKKKQAAPKMSAPHRARQHTTREPRSRQRRRHRSHDPRTPRTTISKDDRERSSDRTGGDRRGDGTGSRVKVSRGSTSEWWKTWLSGNGDLESTPSVTSSVSSATFSTASSTASSAASSSYTDASFSSFSSSSTTASTTAYRRSTPMRSTTSSLRAQSQEPSSQRNRIAQERRRRRRGKNKERQTTTTTTRNKDRPEPLRWTLKLPPSVVRKKKKIHHPSSSSSTSGGRGGVLRTRRSSDKVTERCRRNHSVPPKPPVPVQRRRPSHDMMAASGDGRTKRTKRTRPRSRSQAPLSTTPLRESRDGSSEEGWTKVTYKRKHGSNRRKEVNDDSSAGKQRPPRNARSTRSRGSDSRGSDSRGSNNRGSNSRGSNSRGTSLQPRSNRQERVAVNQHLQHMPTRSATTTTTSSSASSTSSTATATALLPATRTPSPPPPPSSSSSPPPAPATKPKNTLEMFRKVYGRNTKGVSVDPMAPMAESSRRRRRNRRGQSAPPPVERGRFWVPPLETDYEISLKVVQGIARDGDISMEESLMATQMLLQRDSVLLGALGIAPKEAQFSEDMDNDDETMKKMEIFMKSQRHIVSRMQQKVMGK